MQASQGLNPFCLYIYAAKPGMGTNYLTTSAHVRPMISALSQTPQAGCGLSSP